MRPYRSTWSFAEYDGSWEEGTLDVTVTPNHIHFAVTEEQAMDSYNEEFTCSVKMPYDKVVELHALLGKALAEVGAFPACQE